MSFLSAGLLTGLIATAIPIALHLLARQQPRRVLFPATRFLKQSLDTHRDRLQVRRWWLLALRMLAIAALAIALARPQINTSVSESWFIIGSIAVTGLALLGMATAAVVRGKSKPLRYGLAGAGLAALCGSAIFGGITMARAPTATVTDTSPAAVAIVIDNSIRTSRVVAREDSGAESAPTRIIGLMREAASWMINEQTSDSLIAVVDRSARPATFSIDHAAAMSRVERTEPDAVVLPLADRVCAAVALVRSSQLERKSVLLITDLTNASFDVDQWKAVEIDSLLKQEPPISLQVLDVGSEAVSNYSLGQLAISDATPPRLAKTSISVVVTSPKSSGRPSAKSLAVQLDLFDNSAAANAGLPLVRDSKVVFPSLRSVDRAMIETGGTATRALLSVPPLDVGTHHGLVKLITDDELDVDNVRYVTFVVRAPKKVLIVAANRDEASVIAGAMTAPLAIDDPLAEYTIEISEFPPADATAWAQFVAVVLIDPQTPPPPIRSAMDSYLQAGGNLLSLLGPSLTRPGDTIDAFPTGIIRPWRIPAPGTFIEVIRPNHPAVTSLREIAGGVPWNAFRVFQYWQITPATSDTVIARYAGTDHPALIERTADVPTNDERGAGDKDLNASSPRGGTHLIFTTPMPALTESTRPWNRLFAGADAWPAFLLIRDMVDSLVYRDRGAHNIQTGDSTRLPISLSKPPLSTETEPSTRAQLFGPTGPPVPLVVEDQGVAITQLSAPGTYWLRTVGSDTGLSVNVPTSDTDLSRMDPTQLDDLLGKDQYTLVRTREEIRQAEGRGQPTRSLYSTCLLLMLIAFIAEQILSNRFYASRAIAQSSGRHMTSFTLDPVFASPWFLIVLAVGTLSVPWLIPVAGRSVTHAQRNVLQWLRTGTALVLLLAVFRPSIVTTDSLPTEATLAVLLDRSRSMSLPADEKGTRAALQNELFQKLLPAIQKLDDSLVLKTLVYAGDVNELTLQASSPGSLIAEPTGDATDIAGALAGALQVSSGRPLAGVVLIGDGVDVLPPRDRSKKAGGNATARDPQSGARLLQNLDVPLWTIAVGPPGDLGQVRDLEIAELGESFGLFSGNEANVEFVVRSRALAGKACMLRVTLTAEEKDAKGIEIASRSVTPSGPEDSISMSIPIVAPAPGRYLMEVRAEPQEGETLLSNNSQVAFVDVRQGGGRVLYLEGQPRPEQQFLLRTLRRFPDLQVNYRWIASDTADRWPIDLGLSEPANQYDVIIIGDLPAKALGDDQLKQMAKRVGEGAALLMIGGTQTFANGGYEKSPFINVLPVKLDPLQKDLSGDVFPLLTQSHPITDLSPSEDMKDQSDIWKKLPPLTGASRFADVRLVPGIEVLLENAPGDPLLVVGEYGSGRVAAFAGDSTWRWWRQGRSLEHRRFWRQMMLWLLNRDADSSESIDIKLAQRRVSVDQSIPYAITYPVKDPSANQTLELSVVDSEGVVTPVKPDALTPGTSVEDTRVEGTLTGFKPGMYRLRAAFSGAEKSMSERSFQVLDQDAELRQPFADHSLLSQLASQTAASGGAMFLPNDVDELIDLITQLRRKSEAPVVQKYRLADSAMTAWPLFVALAGLLSVEWYLRRRWGLA